jgi:hypothetical protein
MPLVFFFCGSLESLTSAFLVISSTSRVCETFVVFGCVLFLVVWSGWVGYPVPVLVDAARVLPTGLSKVTKYVSCDRPIRSAHTFRNLHPEFVSVMFKPALEETPVNVCLFFYLATGVIPKKRLELNSRIFIQKKRLELFGG